MFPTLGSSRRIPVGIREKPNPSISSKILKIPASSPPERERHTHTQKELESEEGRRRDRSPSSLSLYYSSLFFNLISIRTQVRSQSHNKKPEPTLIGNNWNCPQLSISTRQIYKLYVYHYVQYTLYARSFTRTHYTLPKKYYTRLTSRSLSLQNLHGVLSLPLEHMYHQRKPISCVCRSLLATRLCIFFIEPPPLSLACIPYFIKLCLQSQLVINVFDHFFPVSLFNITAASPAELIMPYTMYHPASHHNHDLI